MGQSTSKCPHLCQAHHIAITTDQVERLFGDNNFIIPPELSQELLSNFQNLIDKKTTVAVDFTTEVLGKVVSCLEDKQTPISESSGSTSTPTKECIKAEPTSDAPAQATPKVLVEVVDPLPSGATKNFLSALSDILEKHNMSLTDYTVQQLNEDEHNNKRVLVVCNNHSRLLADIQSTLSVINSARYERIILLVVHCQKEKHLPVLTSLSQLRDTPDFKELRDVLDIAFDGDHGIYDCVMNKRALEVFHDMLSKGLLSGKNDSENDESQRKKMKQEDELNQEKDTS